MVDCFKTKGKPNCKKGKSANAAREKEEVLFVCMSCNEDDISHKLYSFEPVDNAMDDEGYPVPDSFFDSFGESDKEDDETACYSVPEWCPSDEENTGMKEWCGTQEEDPVLEEKWIEATHKKVGRRRTKKRLSKSTHGPKGAKTPKATRGNTRDKKLTRVHNCKRGKPTRLKSSTNLKSSVDLRVLDPHSNAEDANVNSNLVCHHVDQDVKPLHRGGVLQANSSIHGGEEFPTTRITQ